MKKLIYAAIVLFMASCSGGKTTQEAPTEDQMADSIATTLDAAKDSLSVKTDATLTEVDSLLDAL